MSDDLIEAGLVNYLKGKPTISNIVGDRVFPGLLPQEVELPTVLVLNVGTVPVAFQAKRPSTATTRFQIDCYARTLIEAKLLSKAVGEVLILNSYAGVMFDSFSVQAVFEIEGGVDDFDDIPDDFRVSSEYRIWHKLLYNT